MMITPKRRKAEVNKAVRRKGLRTLAARYLNAACIVALMVSMIPANLVLPLAAAESVSGQEEAYVAPSASATVIPEASETPATELPEETAQATETPTQEPTAAAEATATAEPAEEPTDEPTQEVTATPTAAPRLAAMALKASAVTQPTATATATPEPSAEPADTEIPEASETPAADPSEEPADTATPEPAETATAEPAETPTEVPAETPAAEPTQAPALALDALAPEKSSVSAYEDIVWHFNASGATELTYVIINESGEEVAYGTLTGEREIRWQATAGGRYTLKLTAWDESNRSLSATSEVTVVYEALEAGVTSGMRYAFANQNQLTFDTAVQGGTEPYAVHYSITRGGAVVYEHDGYAATVRYMPTEIGDYTLTMTVTDATGAKASAQRTIPVAVDEREQRSAWERTVSGVKLTGDFAEDLLAIAATQLNYQESSRNFIVGDNGATYGYTRYGDWYGNAYGEWSAMFVSFCASYAQIPDDDLPQAGDSASLMKKLGSLYIDAEDEYVPEAGDLIFFNDNRKNAPQRMGIVTDVSSLGGGDYRIRTIEGDSADAVRNGEYQWTDERIVGYASMGAIAALEQDAQPTAEPTAEVTAEPTAEPTTEVTAEPSAEPTAEVTAEPTAEPTAEVTAEPTAEPTIEVTAEPSIKPSEEPTAEPSIEPSEEPTVEPSTEPSEETTVEPSIEPSEEPTETPAFTLNNLAADKAAALVGEEIAWTFESEGANSLIYLITDENGGEVASGALGEERELRWTAEAAGAYTLTLTALNDNGDLLSATSDIVVTGPAEEVPPMTLDSLIPDRDSALVNEDIVWTFNAGNAAALHYVLADQNGNPVAAGELTEERDIRWTAQAAGEYALTLTATDEAGATLTAFSFVSITATELAATVASEAGYAVLGTDTLHFETGVTGGTLPYAIHYNLDLNGSTAYEQDGFAAALQYTPAEAGTYTFTMTVSDANGAETTAQCTVAVADINAVEQQSDWEAGLAGAALTGDYAADLLAVAGTQLGYAESAANFILDENGEAHAYTRYGAWYGDPYGDWNAMFLSFCANYAGIPEGVLPEAADSDAYESAGNGYVPAAGDVVFFTDGRTGIVSDVQVAEDGSYRFFAIEGDLSGTVGQAEYEGSDSRIAGYANMAVAQYGEPAAEPDASETDQIWTDLAAGAELTNEWRDDLLAVARTQIGYQESETDVSLDEAGNASGYTLYGRLMGDAHMDWNAAFAAFVTLQAGVSDAPTAADAQSWLNQAKARGMYYGADYEAQPGDLIFLDTNADGAADRVGIVEVGAYDGQLIAIEGDLDGASGRVSYAVNDARILGYENPVTTLTDEATGVSVTGVLPAAAVLSVTPVKIDTPDAEAAAAGEGQTEENATIEEGETAEECITTYTEGNNVVKRIVYDINLGGYQPCKNVTVIMPLPEDFGGEPTVYHYDGETYEREEEMEGEPSEDGGQYTFVTSHFSLLGAESITLLAATPGVLSTVDSISDGITINVLDYGPTTLDVSSNNYNSPSYTGINNYYGQYSTRDKRYTNVLFFGYGTSGGTTLNHYSGGKTAMQGIVRSLLSDGYPALTTRSSSSGNSLAYLFNTTAISGAKSVYANANHLFTLDSNGYYKYDSDLNYAYLDTSTKNFTVYNGTFDLTDGSPVGFFPFTPYDSTKTSVGYNSYYNHHFGMTVATDFMMPVGGQVSGNDMTFNFSGDDDMWVFIDDVLVLDLGGIHGAASGYINFATGAVRVTTGVQTISYRYYTDTVTGATNTLSTIFSNAGKTWNGSDYSMHTFKCFYMERGGQYSNCQVTFNLFTVSTKDLTIQKEVENVPAASASAINNMDFHYQLYIETGLGTGTYELYEGDGYLNGGTTATEITNGMFSLKNGQTMVIKDLQSPLRYYVKEFGVDGAMFSGVTVYSMNGSTVNSYATTSPVPSSGVITSLTDTVKERPKILFSNQVRPGVETISIRIVKEWDDGGTSVDHSGDSITARLYADTVEVRSVTLNAANNWEQTITGLPKYVSGTSQEIVYTVSEDSVAHYTMSVAELDGTERIWVPTMSLSDDTEYIILTSRSTGTIMGMTANDDGVAWTSTNSAESIQVTNGTTVFGGVQYNRYITDAQAQLHPRMIWLANSVGLKTGNQVGTHDCYTLYNAVVGKYAKDTGQGDLVTDPNNNACWWYYGYFSEGVREPSNEYTEWSYLLGSINDYWFLSNNHTGDANAETAQVFFLYKAVDTSSKTFTITNTRDTSIDVSITKQWNDGGADHMYTYAGFSLWRSGGAWDEYIGFINLTMANSWTYTFENLPRYTGTGTEYTYYFVENSLDGYDVDITYTRDADGNYSFTAVNTEVIDVTVNKVWNDGGADHTGDTVTVSLYRQAGAAAREHVADQTLPVSGAWSYTFADLPRYDANGDEYAYTLEEAAVAGYAAGIAFTKDECGDYTFTVTNVKQISVTVTKVWNDGGLDHSGDTVTVLLYRKVGTGTATQIASQVLPVSGSWTYTFASLPAYDSSGNEYVYSVQEETVPDGYYAQITSARDGDGNYTFTITNTLLTDITVTKVWDDGGMDHSGDTVTVTLYRQLNTTKTLIASQTLPVGGLWTYTFADLPRYDASGNEYTYLIEEDAVTGYSTVITFERDAEGNWIYTVTNTLRVGLVIEKRDSANGATLPGAKFDLYRQAGSTETGAVPVPGSSVYGVLIGIDYTSGADGRITIDGLLPATYWLVETQAPSGYKLPPNALGFTLGADGTVSGLSDTTYMALPASGSGLSLIVKDEKSSVLPDTGGPGTLIGTWLGLALIAITCFMYIALRANKRGKEAGFFSR